MTLFELLIKTTGVVHIYNTQDSDEATLCFCSEAGSEGYIKSWITEDALKREVNRIETDFFDECVNVYLRENY